MYQASEFSYTLASLATAGLTFMDFLHHPVHLKQHTFLSRNSMPFCPETAHLSVLKQHAFLS